MHGHLNVRFAMQCCYYDNTFFHTQLTELCAITIYISFNIFWCSLKMDVNRN